MKPELTHKQFFQLLKSQPEFIFWHYFDQFLKLKGSMYTDGDACEVTLYQAKQLLKYRRKSFFRPSNIAPADGQGSVYLQKWSNYDLRRFEGQECFLVDGPFEEATRYIFHKLTRDGWMQVIDLQNPKHTLRLPQKAVYFSLKTQERME